MGTFEVVDAGTIEEALLLLSRYGEQAKLIAGGTDLLPKLKEDRIDLKYLVNILRIPGLDRIEMDAQGTLRLGSLTTIQSILDSTAIKDRIPVLAEATAQLGSPQIRNTATLGGNLCNGSPAADMAPPLMVLEAKASSMGKKGQRTISIENLFSGPSETMLPSEEILVQIQVPPFPDRSGAAFIKFGLRKAMEIALASVAVFVQLDPERQRFQEVRIALGAVAATPIRVRRAEESLKGRDLGNSLIENAACLASQGAKPISDFRASASYRREIVRVLTVRGLELGLSRALGASC